jgi:hypothetical protein
LAPRLHFGPLTLDVNANLSFFDFAEEAPEERAA